MSFQQVIDFSLYFANSWFWTSLIINCMLMRTAMFYSKQKLDLPEITSALHHSMIYDTRTEAKISMPAFDTQKYRSED